MGIFSKTPKLKPSLIIEGIEITFHQEYGGWEFTYRGNDFCSFEPTLRLPTKPELDSILHTVDSLEPEMRARLQKGLSEWANSKLDDGESYSVNIQDFAAQQSFGVSWSGGASWGDLGVDFTIRDHTIVDEGWGD